jgi:transporter family-2 protein
MQQIIFMLVAVVAGAVLPLQAGMNTRMGHSLGNPMWASFISFVIGAVGVFGYMLATKVPLNLISNARTAPAYLWVAGFLGAFYVSSVILLVPRLGVALTFGLVIAGQMVISVLIDHLGLMGVPVKEASLMRVLGILLLVVGVVIIRKF